MIRYVTLRYEQIQNRYEQIWYVTLRYVTIRYVTIRYEQIQNRYEQVHVSVIRSIKSPPNKRDDILFMCFVQQTNQIARARACWPIKTLACVGLWLPFCSPFVFQGHLKNALTRTLWPSLVSRVLINTTGNPGCVAPEVILGDPEDIAVTRCNIRQLLLIRTRSDTNSVDLDPPVFKWPRERLQGGVAPLVSSLRAVNE